MIDLDKFDWGWMETTDLGLHHKNSIKNEIFEQNVYERFFYVENDDIVLDIGASVGPFTYSILHKKPKKVFCLEPSLGEINTLIKNVGKENVTIIQKAISSNDGPLVTNKIFSLNGIEMSVDSISFKSLIEQYQIDKIDFLKTDCESGEYDIFNRENIWWIKNNVKKISGEWHLELNGTSYKENFREFRDIYLKLFPNHQIFSLDGVDIKWNLWDENFLEYYKHVLIYIDNR